MINIYNVKSYDFIEDKQRIIYVVRSVNYEKELIVCSPRWFFIDNEYVKLNRQQIKMHFHSISRLINNTDIVLEFNKVKKHISRESQIAPKGFVNINITPMLELLQKFNNTEVFLYGSHLLGLAKKESDLDLIIKSSEHPSKIFKALLTLNGVEPISSDKIKLRSKTYSVNETGINRNILNWLFTNSTYYITKYGFEVGLFFCNDSDSMINIEFPQSKTKGYQVIGRIDCDECYYMPRFIVVRSNKQLSRIYSTNWSLFGISKWPGIVKFNNLVKINNDTFWFDSSIGTLQLLF